MIVRPPTILATCLHLRRILVELLLSIPAPADLESYLSSVTEVRLPPDGKCACLEQAGLLLPFNQIDRLISQIFKAGSGGFVNDNPDGIRFNPGG